MMFRILFLFCIIFIPYKLGKILWEMDKELKYSLFPSKIELWGYGIWFLCKIIVLPAIIYWLING